MMKLVTVSFCVFINLWPRPRDDWPRPRPRPRPHSFWPRPRPWPHELMASLTSLVLSSLNHQHSSIVGKKFIDMLCLYAA